MTKNNTFDGSRSDNSFKSRQHDIEKKYIRKGKENNKMYKIDDFMNLLEENDKIYSKA